MLVGPLDTVLVVAALVVAVAVWLVRRRHYPGPRLVGRDEPIDREALEAAEREVRDLGRGVGAEGGDGDEIEDDDWGPGTVRRPRTPLEL